MRAARVFLFILVPLTVTVILGLLARFGAFALLDGSAYDRLMRLRPPAEPARNVLLVDVDVPAGSLAGLVADGLVTLKELDARYVLLDLPLARRSPPALDPSVLRQTLPNALDREFSQMQENIQSLFDAIRRGAVRPREAARYVSDLVGLVGMAKGRLFAATMGIERDDDALLGQAEAFFGNVFVPLDLAPAGVPQPDAELLDLALRSHSVAVVLRGNDMSIRAENVHPSVLPVVRGARGGGFPSDSADIDGVRRRTHLFAVSNGQHIAQLGFAGLLNLLGNPGIEIFSQRVLLHGAALPGGQETTIEIPLTDTGEVLLAWPRNGSGDGFRHLAWSSLLQMMKTEDALVAVLREMDSKGYLSYLRASPALLDVYEEGARLGRDMLAAGTDIEGERWRAARTSFFALCDQFLNGDAEARIVADADRALGAGGLSEDEKAVVRGEQQRVPAVFAEARRLLADLQAARASIQRSVAGSFCIVSLDEPQALPGTARTPFGAPATDARASAALVSTVLSGRFLRQLPDGPTFAIAAALGLLVALGLFRLRPALSLFVAEAIACGVLAGLAGIFAIWGAFVPPAVPVGSAALTGVALWSLKMGWKRRAARLMRTAFSTRVSAESFRAIQAVAGRLAREPARREVTILSLTESGLSRAAESEGGAPQGPREVVQRLRTYHAAVGEAIRGLDGMVDGTGGRVTAYFGAPVEREDHARRACLAALRVLALEKELNGVTRPVGSLTRIGIDTGACVAGFMDAGGTPGYSLVGAPVDLAARLEGMNAGFGTTILISERVREAAGPGFIVRMLGRTVGGDPRAPVRLFELVTETGAVEAAMGPRIALFEEGLARFEAGDLSRALSIFSRLLAEHPGDGPAAAYAQRCRQLMEKPGSSPLSFFPG